jgi:hypothetical protein
MKFAFIWQKIGTLFGKNRLPDWLYKRKRIDVYFNKPNGILIATTHHDLNGFPGAGDPMLLLPIDATEIEIGGFLLQSIPQSKSGLSVHELDEIIAKMLRTCGAKQFRDLEKQWDYICITCSEGEELLMVMPMYRVKTGGYRAVERGEIRCPLTPLDIGKTIRRIIDDFAEYRQNT